MKNFYYLILCTSLILVACAKNGKEKKDELLKDFKLELPDLNIDFTKPEIIKYNTTFQRDSILAGLANELSESFQDPSSEIDSVYNKVLISVGNEANTIKVQLQKNTEVDFSDWNNLGICRDAKSLKEKLNNFIIKNEAAHFGIEYLNNDNNFQLFGKK